MTPGPAFSVSFLDGLRRGEPAALEVLARRYRSWLGLLARLQVESHLQGKFDASDLVQQTMLAACRDAQAFRGTSEVELLAWLRQILAHVLAHEIRRYRGTQQRQVDLEIALEQELGASSRRLNEILAAPDSSPSEQAMRHEAEVRLADVLASLPDDHREVILLRNMEGLPHEEVARRMDRSVGAVRMLWVRALTRLREELKEIND